MVLFIVGIMTSMVSCESFTEFEIPKEPDVIVLGGVFPVNRAMSVTLSRSKHVTVSDINYESILNNATIEVLEGEIVVDQLIVDTTLESIFLPSRYISSTGFQPQAGNNYTIEINAPGFSSASASTVVLKQIAIDAFEFENRIVQISETFFGYPVSMEFDDPEAENNYYRLETVLTVQFEPGGMLENDTTILLVSPKLTQGQGFAEDIPLFHGLYFSDIQFKGEKQNMEFIVDASRLRELLNAADDENELTSVSISVILKHITKENYDYGITSDLQKKINDDPFAEPVQVRTNVENGLGIFAGYSYDVYSIDVLN